GYEFQVSRPKVILREIDGKMCEPFERVQIDTPEEYMGSIIEALGSRKAEMADMIHTGNGQVRLVFLVAARVLSGFSTLLMSITRGYGIINHTFDDYLPVIEGSIGRRRNGTLVSIENGTATTYSIMALEDRGTIFVEPGTEVYGGMIVGEHNRENDLTVNITKEKKLTNMRSATKDHTVTLKKTRHMSWEEAIQYLNDAEYCECTPESIRLRKKILHQAKRQRESKRKKRNE